MDPIEIVDLDLKKTTWSRVHAAMRTLYLRLSAEPDLDWIRFFREERESRIVARRHGLWIEDGYIVFDCLLDEVRTHHLPDFQQSIDYANARWRELRETRRQQSVQRRTDQAAERALLAQLRATIRNAADGAAAGIAAPAPAAESAIDPAASAAATGFEPNAAAPAANTAAASADAAHAGNVAPAEAENPDADFDARRDALRALFRAALKSRNQEPDRGND